MLGGVQTEADAPARTVVFVMGGMTQSEMRSAYEITEARKMPVRPPLTHLISICPVWIVSLITGR